LGFYRGALKYIIPPKKSLVFEQKFVSHNLTVIGQRKAIVLSTHVNRDQSIAAHNSG